MKSLDVPSLQSVDVTVNFCDYRIYANLVRTLFEVFWVPKTGCALESMVHKMRTQSEKLRFRCQSGRRNLFSFTHCARVNMAVYCAKLWYSNRMDRQRRLSYTAKCKCKVILLAEKEGNRHAAREFSVPENNVRLRKHKDAIFASKQYRKKFTGPRKGRHLEVDRKLLEFVLERRKNGLPVTSDIIREKANEVARARNIQRHVFKASRGWVDRLRRNGLSVAPYCNLSEAPY